MQKFINKLISKVIAQQPGDIVALHKGSVRFSNDSNGTDFPKGKSVATLRAVLQRAIDTGKFAAKPLFVPDVSEFNLVLNGMNPALLGAGISSRLGSEKTLKPNRNRRINRYLAYSYLRLSHQAEIGDVTGFYKTAQILISRSNCYMVASLHSIDKNLYRNVGLRRLRKIMMQVNDLRASIISSKAFRKWLRIGNLVGLMAHVMKFHRTYIPKSPGKVRPLGVPDLAWRVYTKMWLLPLQLMHPIGEYQHGFIPRRGTLTAWNKLVTEVFPKRNIYEIDFEGFFPSVQPEQVTKVLNAPTEIKTFFEDLNESKPIFTDTAKAIGKDIPETLYTNNSVQALFNETYKMLFRVFFEKTPDWLDEFIQEMEVQAQLMLDYIENKSVIAATDAPIEDKLPGSEVDLMKLSDEELEAHFMQEGLRFEENLVDPTTGDLLVFHPEDLMSTMESLEQEQQLHSQWGLEAAGSPLVHSGLPQGSPLSPFLSILVLDAVRKLCAEKYPEVGWLFYADDGMFYSDNDEQFDSFLDNIDGILKEFGIKISKKKSNLTRYQGRFNYHRTKFLGIVKDHETGEIYSETRKGNSLLYSFQDIVAFSAYLQEKSGKEKLSKLLELVVPKVNPSPLEGHTDYVFLYLFLIWKLRQWPIEKQQVFFNRFLHLLGPEQRKSVERFLELDQDQIARALLRENSPQSDPFKSTPTQEDTLTRLIREAGLAPKAPQGPFEGPFGGIIQSRMYLGSELVPSFDTDSGSQDFEFRAVPSSLGHVMKSKIQDHLTLGNGSSYACGEMVRILGSITEGRKKPILRGGPVL